MKTPGRLIGPHLQVHQGLRNAADRAREIGATAVQVFTDNPTAWRRRAAPPAELAEFRARLAGGGIRSLAIHAPYLVNLCGADDEFWARSVVTMAHELTVGRDFGADFVVMHIGSHRGEERSAGIERLVCGLGAVLREADQAAGGQAGIPRLVLENSAGMGDGIGSSLEDLSDILGAAVDAGLPLERLGVCLDTAHLWGAGYDVGSAAWLEGFAERSERLLGRENVVMLHLNDSRTELGSRLDRHEHIGAGKMGHEGLRDLLNHPWLGTLPTFLETPGMDAGYDVLNLDRARLLADGQALPTLPPEAFTLRRSAARSGPPAA
ncbi:MAG: deoxyribonuclease IV [Chloroflexota bacterium]|nr:deoxyribonuclease IV [Chloroflexota bacterium]